jgi:hypothetical protein
MVDAHEMLWTNSEMDPGMMFRFPKTSPACIADHHHTDLVDDGENRVE